MEVLKQAYDKAKDSAVLFNKIKNGGLSISEYSNEKLFDDINKQVDIVLSELVETIDATDVNLIEELDGYGDSIYTLAYLDELVNEFNSRELQDDEVGGAIKKKRLGYALNIGNLVCKEIQRYPEIVAEATDRIIDNNNLKFTKDSEEFATWKSTFNRKTVEVDGEYYYFLADNNLKVRKKENFEKVILDDLVEKMVEKDNVKT